MTTNKTVISKEDESRFPGEEPASSVNIFTVQLIDISQEPSSDGIIIFTRAGVDAQIEARCVEHGNLQWRLLIHSEATGLDHHEALRKAVERLMNHEGYPERQIMSPRCNCKIDMQAKLHYVFSNLQSPFRELFEQLFTDSNWQIPKLVTES